MTKTIAITGATGFTGGAIVRYFRALGWRVLAFGRRPYPNLPKTVVYRRWNIAHGKITVKDPIDVVVHVAAMVEDRGKRADFMKVNVEGTQHVLDTFRDAGQFIYVSSSSVYDPFGKKDQIAETYPYGERYLNAYGESKMLAEKTVINDPRTNKIILRPRAIYGEGDTTLLPRLLNLYRAGYMLGFGDGSNEISITYIGNFCHAIACAIQQTVDCEIFNITDSETITQQQLLVQLCRLQQWQYKPFFISRPVASRIASVSQVARMVGIPTQLSNYSLHNLSETFTLDISKARDVLNYSPRFRQAEGFSAVQADLEHGQNQLVS